MVSLMIGSCQLSHLQTLTVNLIQLSSVMTSAHQRILTHFWRFFMKFLKKSSIYVILRVKNSIESLYQSMVAMGPQEVVDIKNIAFLRQKTNDLTIISTYQKIKRIQSIRPPSDPPQAPLADIQITLSYHLRKFSNKTTIIFPVYCQ